MIAPLTCEQLRAAEKELDPSFVLDKNFHSSVLQMLHKCDLISFDIFDTLLRRPFLQPTHLFDWMASSFHDPDFSYKRMAAEAIARRKYANSIDIDLKQIYEFVDGDYSRELQCERGLLYPRSDVGRMLRIAKDAGKKTVAISDMYLPADIVRGVLEQHELVVDDIIVSSTDGVAKYDGSAFKLAARRHGVGLHSILHIGDNRHSDFAVPTSLGVKAVLVSGWTTSRPPSQLTDTLMWRLANNGSYQSSMLGAAIRDLQHVHGHHEFWSDLGRYHIGPLLFSFATWLRETAARLDVDNLIFIARDAWLPFCVFQLLNPQAKASYAYLSRSVLVHAALEKRPEIALTQLVSGIAAPLSNYICRIGPLGDRLLQSAIEAFQGDPIIESATDRRRLADFFLSQGDALSQVGRQSRQYLEEYLSSLGAFHKPNRVAFVDVGWGGSSAAIMRDLFPEARNWHYLYWGTHERFQPSEAKHRAQFFQFGEPWHCRSLAYECIELVELFFTSPEKYVIGLQRTEGGGIGPAFGNDTPASQERSSIVKSIEEGAMQCCQHLLNFQRRFPDLAIDRNAIFAIIENILRTDDVITIHKLGSIQHQVGVGNSVSAPIMPNLSMSYWSTIRRWFMGKETEYNGHQVCWPYQQNRHFIAETVGFKRVLAIVAYQVKLRGGLRSAIRQLTQVTISIARRLMKGLLRRMRPYARSQR